MEGSNRLTMNRWTLIGEKERIRLERIASFVLVMVGSITYSQLHQVEMNIMDASYYISIGDVCFDELGFHISIFPKTFRGCLFPLYLQVLKHSFLGLKFGWSLTTGFILASLFTVIIPSFFHRNDIHKNSAFLTVIPAAIYIFFWGDTLLYPLSDLVAVFSLISGIWILLLLVEYKEWSRRKILILSFGSGALLYFTYNTRVIFLYGILVSIVVYVISCINKVKRISFSLACILIGVIVVSVPQVVVNYFNENTFSPRVFTENYGIQYGGGDLKVQQIKWGLQMHRYESCAAEDDDAHVFGAIYFPDTYSSEILNREGLEEPFELKTFVSLWFKYPLDMVGIYARHFVSVMTPIWNQIYVTRFLVNHTVIVALSMIIWLLSGISILITSSYELRVPLIPGGFVVAIIIPAVIQTIGAPEVRFFLPVYVMAYSYVVNGIEYKLLYRRIKKQIVPIVFAILVVSAIWIACLEGVMSSFYQWNTADQRQVILINDSTVDQWRNY